MSRFEFIIGRTQEVKVVYADLSTRWCRGHRIPKAVRGNIVVLYHSPVLTSMEMEDGTTYELEEIHRKYDAPSNPMMNADGLSQREGKAWIPPEEDGIELRILKTAHSANDGHRGTEVTEKPVRS